MHIILLPFATPQSVDDVMVLDLGVPLTNQVSLNKLYISNLDESSINGIVKAFTSGDDITVVTRPLSSHSMITMLSMINEVASMMKKPYSIEVRR